MLKIKLISAIVLICTTNTSKILLPHSFRASSLSPLRSSTNSLVFTISLAPALHVTPFSLSLDLVSAVYASLFSFNLTQVYAVYVTTFPFVVTRANADYPTILAFNFTLALWAHVMPFALVLILTLDIPLCTVPCILVTLFVTI